MRVRVCVCVCVSVRVTTFQAAGGGKEKPQERQRVRDECSQLMCHFSLALRTMQREESAVAALTM